MIKQRADPLAGQKFRNLSFVQCPYLENLPTLRSLSFRTVACKISLANCKWIISYHSFQNVQGVTKPNYSKAETKFHSDRVNLIANCNSEFHTLKGSRVIKYVFLCRVFVAMLRLARPWWMWPLSHLAKPTLQAPFPRHIFFFSLFSDWNKKGLGAGAKRLQSWSFDCLGRCCQLRNYLSLYKVFRRRQNYFFKEYISLHHCTKNTKKSQWDEKQKSKISSASFRNYLLIPSNYLISGLGLRHWARMWFSWHRFHFGRQRQSYHWA